MTSQDEILVCAMCGRDDDFKPEPKLLGVGASGWCANCENYSTLVTLEDFNSREGD